MKSAHVFVLVAFVVPAVFSAEANGEPSAIAYGPANKLCTLADEQVRESSGLACSRRADGLFWTHNDSGDTARLFRFDAKGRDLGTFAVPGAKARDWEDMASFCRGDVDLLLLADVGDNAAKRKKYRLYIVEEPTKPAKPAGPGKHRAKLVETVEFRYEDGPHNCESVAVDPVRGEVLLVTKTRDAACGAYLFRLPGPAARQALVARRIATLAIPTATAMDISPDGSRAVVLTYGDAFEFTRKPDEDWTAALSRPPRRLAMPRREQGESICFGRDGKTLHLTSKKLPTPLWEVPVAAPPRRD